MTAIEVPLLADELRNSLKKVIDGKGLGDDIYWRTDIRPALSQRIRDLKRMLDASHLAPENDLLQSLDYVQHRIDVTFLYGAPFTVHRLAELILYYRDSGYSLDTPQQAEKYVDALRKVVLVLSKESEFDSNTDEDQVKQKLTLLPESPHLASSIDYQGHKLPTNVPFVMIPWGVSHDTEVTYTELEERVLPTDEGNTIPEDRMETPKDGELSDFEGEIPPSKRPKTDAGEDEDQALRNGRKTLLSPLPETKTGEDLECDAGGEKRLLF